jgi:hypothetical protein
MNSIRSSLLATCAFVALCSCARNVALPAAANAEFQPMAFFQGHSHGEGQLRKLFNSPVSVTVDSVGYMRSGRLVLDQTIRENGKPPSTRRWIIASAGPARYSGMLTDAVGNVEGWVDGPRLYIRYAMKHGLTVQQQLAEQPDGQTVLNRLVVYKLGVRVATLTETIRKPG